MYNSVVVQNGLDMNKALATLLERLNDIKIRYFLLTDFESDLASRDMDLFVHPDCKNRFLETLHKSGWYKRKEPTHHVNHHFYYSPESHIYLDVKYDMSFANGHKNCFTYKEQERALSDAVLNSKGIYRPKGIDALLLYAAHLGYKERGKLEGKHKAYLSTYLSYYRSETSGNTDITVEKISAWLTDSFPHNLNELQQIIRPYFNNEQKRMVRKKGRFNYGLGVKVLFLGTDGSGKTTLIEEVNKGLHLKTRKLYLGMGEEGWSSAFIKNIYKYKSNVRLVDRLFTLLKQFLILPLELLLRIIPVKLKAKYSVVLIDRFPGFVFLGNKSFRKYIYQTILPHPDLVFFLYAAPEELVRRKPDEITLERSKADIAKFKQVAEIISDGKYISLDTSKLTIEQSSDYIISEIYKHPKTYSNLLIPSFK